MNKSSWNEEKLISQFRVTQSRRLIIKRIFIRKNVISCVNDEKSSMISQVSRTQNLRLISQVRITKKFKLTSELGMKKKLDI